MPVGLAPNILKEGREGTGKHSPSCMTPCPRGEEIQRLTNCRDSWRPRHSAAPAQSAAPLRLAPPTAPWWHWFHWLPGWNAPPPHLRLAPWGRARVAAGERSPAPASRRSNQRLKSPTPEPVEAAHLTSPSSSYQAGTWLTCGCEFSVQGE